MASSFMNRGVQGPLERKRADTAKAAAAAAAAAAATAATTAADTAAATAATAAATAATEPEAAAKLVDDVIFPYSPPGDLDRYHNIAYIGCAYRKYLSSIMQNPFTDHDQKKKLILHVRSILYCYIVNIGFTRDKGNEFFDKAKLFLNNKGNIDKLKTMRVNNEKYVKLFKSDGYGTWDNGLGAVTSGNGYYPTLLNENEFVDADGLLKTEGVVAAAARGHGVLARYTEGGGAKKKKRTTKKRKVKKGTTKKKRVKRRKYSLKR